MLFVGCVMPLHESLVTGIPSMSLPLKRTTINKDLLEIWNQGYLSSPCIITIRPLHEFESCAHESGKVRAPKSNE